MKNMMTQTFPLQLPYWLVKFINFFAADDGGGMGADKTGKNDNAFEGLDDLEDFGEDKDEEDNESEQDEDKDEEDKDDKDKEKEKEKPKSDKKSSSAVIQKQKYRQQLREAQARIKELESKKDDGRSLSDEEKKEQQANEFLVSKIKEVLDAQKKLEEQSKIAAEEAFEDELDAILESNTDFTETQIRDVCDELDISPEAALKVLKREEKLKGKPKPKMPSSKRGTGKVEDDSPKDKKPQTLDDAAKQAKEKIRQGIL